MLDKKCQELPMQMIILTVIIASHTSNFADESAVFNCHEIHFTHTNDNYEYMQICVYEK